MEEYRQARRIQSDGKFIIETRNRYEMVRRWLDALKDEGTSASRPRRVGGFRQMVRQQADSDGLKTDRSGRTLRLPQIAAKSLQTQRAR